MEFKYKTNDYGKVIIQTQDKSPTERSIFYIHDFYDKPENFEPFIKQLKMFNFYGVFFPMDQTEEKYLNNNGWDLNKLYQYVKDVLISLDLNEIYLIGNGIGATLALMLAEEVKLKFIKLILINPLCSKTSRHTREKLKNIPGNVDEMYALMELTYAKNDKVFWRAKDGNEVIDNTRRFVYNHYIYKKIMFDLLSTKTTGELRKYEKKLSLPTMVIVGGCDHLYLSTEIKSSYSNNDSTTIVELHDCGHYPWRDNYDEFIDVVMRFLFTGEKLYSNNKLPPEYLYKYLAEDVKASFKTTFAKQIAEREQKEAEKNAKLEIGEQVVNEGMSEEEVEYYMKFQSETIQASIANAKQYIEEINKANAKPDNEDFITFDQKRNMSNIIYITKEGYPAYHDGKGNNFYQLPNSKTWIPSIFNKDQQEDE